MSRAQRRHTPQAPASSRRNLIVYGTIALVVIGAIVAVGYASRVPQAATEAPIFAQVKAGDPAPHFAVQTSAGPFDSAQNGGKPTVLELFATWCPHCQDEAPVLNGMYAKYKDRLNFVAVTASDTAMDEHSKASADDLAAFAKKYDVKYPVSYDADRAVAKQYLQGGFPTLVFIGRDGKVRDVVAGTLPKDQFEAKVKAAIK